MNLSGAALESETSFRHYMQKSVPNLRSFPSFILNLSNTMVELANWLVSGIQNYAKRWIANHFEHPKVNCKQGTTDNNAVILTCIKNNDCAPQNVNLFLPHLYLLERGHFAVEKERNLKFPQCTCEIATLPTFSLCCFYPSSFKFAYPSHPDLCGFG